MPPESVLRIENQSYSSDIWPMGIILLQFASKRYNIFSNLSKLQQHFKLEKAYYVSFLLQLGSLFGKQKVTEEVLTAFNYELKLPEVLKEVNLRDICIMQDFDDTTFDLMVKLLTIDPQKRITVEAALEHPFFKDVHLASS
jgi:cell division control protein 7